MKEVLTVFNTSRPGGIKDRAMCLRYFRQQVLISNVITILQSAEDSHCVTLPCCADIVSTVRYVFR